MMTALCCWNASCCMSRVPSTHQVRYYSQKVQQNAPCTQGPSLSTVPHLAALHHNDCQHLAAAIALLPAAHPSLASLLGGAPCFVGVALQLRAAGRSVLRTCIDVHVQVRWQSIQLGSSEESRQICEVSCEVSFCCWIFDRMTSRRLWSCCKAQGGLCVCATGQGALRCGGPSSRCCSGLGSWPRHCSRCCRSVTWWRWHRSCCQGAAAKWQVGGQDVSHVELPVSSLLSTNLLMLLQMTLLRCTTSQRTRLRTWLAFWSHF